MASIVFTAPQHIEPSIVKTWAPGVLFVKNKPLRLSVGEYVYVCNRGQIIYRAKFLRPVWLDVKKTGEGELRKPGWSLEVGDPEFPPDEIPWRGRIGFRYLNGELW